MPVGIERHKSTFTNRSAVLLMDSDIPKDPRENNVNTAEHGEGFHT
jgi:hypothetical protein